MESSRREAEVQSQVRNEIKRQVRRTSMITTTLPSNLPAVDMTARGGSASSSAPFTATIGTVESKPGEYTYRSMSLGDVRDYTQHLCGRVKTIIDAAVTDKQQNKALKNLIHYAFWSEHYSKVADWHSRPPKSSFDPAYESQDAFPFFYQNLPVGTGDSTE